MPTNPTRSSQGGDVDGEKPIDISQGEPLKVSNASYDPGYPLGKTIENESMADLVKGFCSYGKSVGE